ncbi:ImmA/IrrE family metallo-endopeptidase [Anaerosolibacter sp.]|uniref:ImmA/IrrE family metallo-endopeptidase n=1 Tax=Anaerosolibacter sp. TaxID=1872527 RepID=UPI0039F0E227
MEWIDEIIIGLLDTYDTSCPYKLCDLLGIEIVKVEKNAYILLKNSSIYIRDYFGRETIFIRNDLAEEDESFYIRHELGHAILHPDIRKSYNPRLINKFKLERQANYFAMKLLNFELDSISFEGFTIEQIASSLSLPAKCLKNFYP